MIFRVIIMSCLLLATELAAQKNTQTVRGKVSDAAVGLPLAYVNIWLPVISMGTTTDDLGNFTLSNVPVGRYDISVSFLGYEAIILKEIQVTSAKEVVLNVALKENITNLTEVVIRPKVSKEQPINTMATVSSKMLSVEEARRYGGGFDDPARLISAFAGVSGNGVGSNAIVVRGNSPQSLQWRLEGVEIPNPNHFADLASFGGGGLTALSAQLVANSDFFSGAMPAEYGNALAGVFDIFMRIGNNEKREHTLAVGVLGLDAASEGPFKKGKPASYLFNYRYSTLGLLESILPENAGGTKYQDLSFKFNSPTQKMGTFTIWGLGLKDESGALAKNEVSTWQYFEDRDNSKVKQYMGVGGVSHRLVLNDKQSLKSTLALTSTGINLETNRVDEDFDVSPLNEINNQTNNLVFSSFINTKFNTKHINKSGITATIMHYDILLKNSPLFGSPLENIISEKGRSALLNGYTNSKLNIGDRIIMNAGVNVQYFNLNDALSIEPRLGVKYTLDSKQSFSFAYGLHSRLERLNYYFIKDNLGNNINRDMRFTKSHHFVTGYNFSPTEFIHINIEGYYQRLFNIPVIADSSFSLINQINDWFLNAPLVSTGQGRNYGVDITFEKYFSKGYYYMVTASLFQSEYLGGDHQWRNTRYNRNFVTNFLIGKEWFWGKNKNHLIGLNTRLTWQGGDRYSPINLPQSLTMQNPVFDETAALSLQFAPLFTNHITANITLNKHKTTQEIALKIINTTMYKEFQGFRYNFKQHTIDQKREAVFIPNLTYKIEF